MYMYYNKTRQALWIMFTSYASCHDVLVFVCEHTFDDDVKLAPTQRYDIVYDSNSDAGNTRIACDIMLNANTRQTIELT